MGWRKSDKNTMCVLVTQSSLTLCDPMDCSPAKILCPWDSPGKNTGVVCHTSPKNTVKISKTWFFSKGWQIWQTLRLKGDKSLICYRDEKEKVTFPSDIEKIWEHYLWLYKNSFKRIYLNELLRKWSFIKVT